jgi:hypothetical protein
MRPNFKGPQDTGNIRSWHVRRAGIKSPILLKTFRTQNDNGKLHFTYKYRTVGNEQNWVFGYFTLKLDWSLVCWLQTRISGWYLSFLLLGHFGWWSPNLDRRESPL